MQLMWSIVTVIAVGTMAVMNAFAGTTAEIKTSMGTIEVALNAEKAPITVKNFVEYAKSRHYDGTIFHRVIKGFMIQGGGFTEDLQQKETRSPIKNEATNGLKNRKYTIAMARTQIVDSATSQFFINVNDNAFLDHRAPNPMGYGYAVFGEVTKGQDVVDKIALVETGNVGYFADVPKTPVVIEKITIKENMQMKKTLVAYFSATGNTKAKAELIAKALGADLKEIVPEKRYTSADLDWHDKKSRSSVEMADKASRPAIAGMIENMADYDTVYLGFPIWWYVAPTIVNTFLEAHDFSGKTIIPFFTSGGSGAGKTLDYLKPSASKAIFAEPKNLTRATESDIREWCKR